MGITRIGSRQIREALKRWGDDIEDDVKRIVVETATILRDEAKARAPVDSGYLRDHIEMEILNGGLSARVLVAAEYAIYIEFGTGIYAVNGNGRKTPWAYEDPKTGDLIWTHGMKAQPFWFPAIKRARNYFNREMKKLGR